MHLYNTSMIEDPWFQLRCMEQEPRWSEGEMEEKQREKQSALSQAVELSMRSKLPRRANFFEGLRCHRGFFIAVRQAHPETMQGLARVTQWRMLFNSHDNANIPLQKRRLIRSSFGNKAALDRTTMGTAPRPLIGPVLKVSGPPSFSSPSSLR